MTKPAKPLFNIPQIVSLSCPARLALAGVLSRWIWMAWEGTSFRGYANQLIVALTTIPNSGFGLRHEHNFSSASISPEFYSQSINASANNVITLPWSNRMNFVKQVRKLQTFSTFADANRFLENKVFLNQDELELFQSILIPI